MESSEANEPTEAIERHDPTEPIERTDPFDPMDRNESSDHRDKREFADRGIASLSQTAAPDDLTRQRLLQLGDGLLRVAHHDALDADRLGPSNVALEVVDENGVRRVDTQALEGQRE